MKKKTLNRIISLIKEQMVASGSLPTNHTGKEIANYDPVMGDVRRRKKKYIKLPPGSRKRWMKDNGES